MANFIDLKSQTGFLRLAAAIFVGALALPVAAKSIVLSAKAGEFSAVPIGTSGSRISISARFRLVEFAPTAGWPSAAYVGFFQGRNRDDSFQFLIIKNRESDSYLVVGYRLLKGGHEVKVASLANLPVGELAEVKLSINAGLVGLEVPGSDLMTIQTDLAEVRAYVSVSSGTAEFDLDEPKSPASDEIRKGVK